MSSSHHFCEVYFIRHGETDWNVQGRIQGHTDIPLNDTGTAQASLLGQLLAPIPFSAAFSSDLSRARQTAELVLQSRPLPIISSPALRERSAGTLEGENTDKLDEGLRPFFLSEKALVKESYLNTPWHPELETSQSVIQRVLDFLFSIISNFQNQSILVVSHGGVLRSLLDHFSFVPKLRWVVANCGYIKIRIEQQTLQLLDCHGVTSRQIF